MKSELNHTQSEDIQYRFLTDITLARQGANVYHALADRLPENVKCVFTNSGLGASATDEIPIFDSQNKSEQSCDISFHASNDKAIKRCFTGISGMVTLQEELQTESSEGGIAEARRAINEQLTNFYMDYPEKISNNNLQAYQLYNVAVIQKAATNYPHIFPHRARADTRMWLQTNRDEWRNNTIQEVLMRGVPLEAALTVNKFAEAKDRLRKVGQIFIRDRNDMDLIETYPAEKQIIGNDTTIPDKVEARMEDLITHINKKLQELERSSGKSLSGLMFTPEQQMTMINARVVHSDVTDMNYIGFNLQKDAEYMNKLDDIYSQSGIDVLKKT